MPVLRALAVARPPGTPRGAATHAVARPRQFSNRPGRGQCNALHQRRPRRNEAGREEEKSQPIVAVARRGLGCLARHLNRLVRSGTRVLLGDLTGLRRRSIRISSSDEPEKKTPRMSKAIRSQRLMPEVDRPRLKGMFVPTTGKITNNTRRIAPGSRRPFLTAGSSGSG